MLFAAAENSSAPVRRTPPYLYAQTLFSDRFRESAAQIWPAYIDGTRTLEQSATDLVAAMR